VRSSLLLHGLENIFIGIDPASLRARNPGSIGTKQNILSVNLRVKLKWCGEKPSVFNGL
jgi:hypothetical protein